MNVTHKYLVTAGLIITSVVPIMSTSAAAQTSAPGAYYVPPAWTQTLPANTRFILLSNFNDEAVLDRETGLVWERAPTIGKVNWENAHNRCAGKRIANRMGWRLPTLPELASLIDGTQEPALPAGHPFMNLNLSIFPFPESYWTVTPDPVDAAWAYVLVLADGGVARRATASNSIANVWCVRGGQATPR